MTALTTEEFVLQTGWTATVNESAARASVYLMSVTASLVAIGFALQSRQAFGAFAGAVIPAVFLLGLFTIIRLVDVNGESMQYSVRMDRIRSYYRSLIPEAAEYFGPKLRSWQEERSMPAMQFGPGIAFLTTTASMVAAINNIVAGAGSALIARRLLGPDHTSVAVVIGVSVATILMSAFLAYQRWRFTMFDPLTPSTEANQA